jgi:aldose sugar dehydrogenase
MGTRSLNRIVFDGNGGADVAERWDMGKRIRDVREGPDGSLCGCWKTPTPAP